MSNSKRKGKPVTKGKSSPLDRQIGKLLTALRFGGAPASREIIKLKLKTTDQELFSLFFRLFNNKKQLDFFHGPAFPHKFSDLFSKPALNFPASPLTEVLWATCRCIQFGDELNRFVKLREQYECSLLRNSRSSGDSILKSIEDDFGHSVWLLQNKLAAAQFWDGIEETRKIVRNYEMECKDNWWLSVIIWFVSKRIEATGLKGHLQSELSRYLEDIDNRKIEIYLKTKLFELYDIHTDDVPFTLLIEAQSCIIDYYETLIAVLQAAAKKVSIPSHMIPALKRPLEALFNRTGDIRLCTIMRGIGISAKLISTYNPKRAELIEAYTKGEYASMIESSAEYLQNAPSDVAIHILRLKACLQSKTTSNNPDGILNDALGNIKEILVASESAYSAAYEIITISERFYGHTWANYFLATMHHELKQEQNIFPSPELRGLFVYDPYPSPFGAVLAQGEAKKEMLNDCRLIEQFPYTRTVFDIVTTGKLSGEYQIQEERQRKYFAIHHLAFGDPKLSIEHFLWLIQNTTGGDRLRSSGGAALGYLKQGKLKEAIDVVVSAFVENKNLPTVLPIRQLVNALGKPINWPDSISVPLLLEIYTTYITRDKLAELRYGFEMFQSKHNIKEPSDLLLLNNVIDKEILIAYLKNVWVPEVMRQTILYAGTKEIEESRIKVCRLLAELDPTNASIYLAEIKERVKQQEIAKVTTLIEQSKVYVEIEAIKRSLRSKLGDSYARYKAFSQMHQQKEEHSVYKKLAETFADVGDEQRLSIPLLLSTMHTVSEGLDSESDVQFDSIISGVTNEFLLGSHGLNAYLSTRVRHGTLSNTLRKPAADEHLITSRKEGGGDYIRNQYWQEIQARNSSFHDEWEKILDALDIFSSELDEVIQYIKDELIQIRVIQKLKDFKGTGENKNALFVYYSSNLERKYLQEFEKNLNGMDELINYCVDILWEKTDRNLQNVQRVLNSNIRERLMKPFDNLTNRLNDINAPNVNDLLNAVGKAKTNTQYKLNLVSSWFKRSEVYDRQDFTPDFPFYVALNMVKNTISTASTWEGATVNLDSNSNMPGRSLDGMVDVFYVLLENAVLRSGVEPDELKVKADVALAGDQFRAKISSSLSNAKMTCEEREKLDKIRESIRSDEFQRRAQGEKGSGLLKIWLTINSPVYKEPTLNFYQSADSQFVVEISFKLEGQPNEYIAN